MGEIGCRDKTRVTPLWDDDQAIRGHAQIVLDVLPDRVRRDNNSLCLLCDARKRYTYHPAVLDSEQMRKQQRDHIMNGGNISA